MNNRARHLAIIAFLIVTCLLLSSCGGGGNNSTGYPIAVSLVQSGTTTSLYAGTSAVTITASIINDTTNAGVSWSLSPSSGCGSLTTSLVTAVYTPPATLTKLCTAEVTATSVNDGTKTSSIMFSVTPVPPAVNVSLTQSGSTTTLDAGSSAVTLTATVTNDTTNAGVTWSLAPASGCGTLVASGMTATYTPPAASSLNADCMATPTATSAANTSRAASIAFSLKAIAIVLGNGQSSTPKTAASGSSLSLSALIVNDISSAATLNWTIAGASCGTLSTGTTASGVPVTYTPPAVGPCTAAVTAATSVNPNVIQIYTITVNAALAITTSSLNAGSYGVSYTTSLAASGGIAPYTWSATSLPPGLTISSGGLISGTPTSVGNFNPQVTASDSQSHSSSLTLNLRVTQKALTVTGLSASNKVYDATNQATVTGTAALSGVVAGDIVTVSGTPTGTFATTAVATAIAVNVSGLTLSGSSAGNYTLSSLTGLTANITPAPLTVSGVTANNKVYDGSKTATLNFTAAKLNGIIGTDSVTLSTTGYTAAFASQNVATGVAVTVSSLQLSGTAAGNYALTPLTGVTANITPATLTVTADNKTMAQGSQVPTFTASYSGFVTGETAAVLTGSPGFSTTPTVTSSSPVGSYTITPSQGTLAAANYIFNFVNGTLTISGQGVVTHLSITGAPSTATVGVAFNNVVVAALDGSNAVVSGYSGTVHFTSSDASAVLPADSTLTLGMGTFAFTLNTVGTQTITVTDTVTSSITGFTNIIVSPVTHPVSGQITLLGGGALSGATLTISPGGLTTTTDSNGNYTFTNVPAGSYTLTPSFTFPTGSDPADSAVFYPANLPINVTGSLTDKNFGAQLGFTVKGTVTYPANALFSTGIVEQLQTYVRLQNPNCSSCATNGTSVLLSTNPNNTASKAFVIHGVYPTGTLTAQARGDNYGYGKPNIGNPTASSTITVTNADVTGVTLALSDAPVPADPGVAPTMTVSTIPNGVAIAYQPIVVGGIEQAASYDLNWSTLSVADCEGASNPPGSTTSGGLNVLVTGYPLPEDSGRVIILDGSAPVNPFNVPNLGGVGTKYYFCMRGNNVTAAPFSTWATAGPITFVGASTTGINTIVPVTIPSGVTVNNVPLYVGCYDSAHSKFYAVSDEAPTVGTRNYSVYIPSGTSCNMFAALDLDLDGLATPSDPFPGAPYSNGGDIFNLGRDFTKYTITSPGTIPVDLTPYKGDTRFLLATQHTLDQNSVESFGVNFDVSSLQSIPVSVQLQTPSPSLNSLLDFAACTTCGQGEFNVTLTTSNVAPSGTYKVNVINSNIPVPAPVAKTATVTGVNNAFTTSLSASGGGTPTFLWGYPASPASYTYKFKITDQYGNVIWQVPVKPSGFDSTAITAGAGFPSTVTQIAWGTDPTGNATNVPTLSSLPSGTYIWSLTTIDSNGNTATQQQVYTF